MDLSYIFSDPLFWLQLIIFGLSIFSYLTKSTRKVLGASFIGSAVAVVIRLLQNDYSTMIGQIFIVARASTYLFRDKIKSNITPWIFIVSQIIVSCFVLNHPIQLFTLFSILFTTWYYWYWYEDIKKYKAGMILSNVSWLIYDIYQQLYISCVLDIIGMALPAMFLINMLIIEPRRNKEHNNIEENKDDEKQVSITNSSVS